MVFLIGARSRLNGRTAWRIVDPFPAGARTAHATA
jgi:hypothetical protein